MSDIEKDINSDTFNEETQPNDTNDESTSYKVTTESGDTRLHLSGMYRIVRNMVLYSHRVKYMMVWQLCTTTVRWVSS